MLSSQDGLHFRDICFMLLQHSLHMQLVSLHYLKCLIEHKAFQPKSFAEIMYSHSTAVLLIFLSDDKLTAIKHVLIGLIVHCVGSELFTKGGILPFIDSIENDKGGEGEVCTGKGGWLGTVLFLSGSQLWGHDGPPNRTTLLSNVSHGI